MDQEEYLKSSFSDIIMRGLKKFITELTSVKFLTLVFIGLGMWQKFIADTVGLSAMLIILGIREGTIENTIEALKGTK